MILKWISLFLSPSAASSINFLGRTTSHSWDKKSCCCNSCCWKNAIPAFTYPKSSSVTSCIIYALFYIYISNAFDIFKNRRTLSHRLIAAMFLSIFLICLSNFSCFFLSSWIFRLYIWPQVDFQIFGEKALWKSRGTFCFQGQGTQRGRWHWASIEWTCKIYYISCILYAWMASRSCVSFCSSIHDASDSVFRWLFLQYREIETSPIVGHELDIFLTDYIVDGTLYW